MKKEKGFFVSRNFGRISNEMSKITKDREEVATDLCTPNSKKTQTQKLHKSTRTSYKQF
jgi:hypothetical protein